jgi:hypothetical protein
MLFGRNIDKRAPALPSPACGEGRTEAANKPDRYGPLRS